MSECSRIIMLLQRLQRYLSQKFIKDVSWNLISIGIVGGCGMLIDIVIGNHYHPEGLGMFQRVFAVYMVSSIFTGLGIAPSVIKHTAEYHDRQTILNALFTGALLLVLGASCTGSALLYIFSPHVIHNPAFLQMIRSLVWAIPLITVNHIILGFCNGLRQMHILAFAQASRAILMFAFIMFAIFFNLDIVVTAQAFGFAESLILVGLGWHVRGFSSLSFRPGLPWMKIHCSYGVKILLARSVAELNRYIDIFMIGYFLSNSAVGVYTLAVSVSKGLTGIAGVFLQSFNPIIARLWITGNIKQLRINIAKLNWGSAFTMTSITLVSGIGFPFFVNVFMRSPQYAESIPIFYVLLLGAWVRCIFYWANGFFAMAGYPGYNVRFSSVVLACNVILNALLIPFWGILGAAIATALADMLLVALLGYFLRTKLDVNIFSFTGPLP